MGLEAASALQASPTKPVYCVSKGLSACKPGCFMAGSLQIEGELLTVDFDDKVRATMDGTKAKFLHLCVSIKVSHPPDQHLLQHLRASGVQAELLKLTGQIGRGSEDGLLKLVRQLLHNFQGNSFVRQHDQARSCETQLAQQVT